MKKQRKINLKSYFPVTWMDLCKTIIILIVATIVSAGMRLLGGNEMYVPLIFVTAVFMIARFTDGYLFGMLSSIVGVIAVNYIFTYPYFKLNFSLSGYPITFIGMFLISVMTSTMMTQIKEQEKVRIEAEREKMRGNLLRAVSHDLRTPLTSIIGTTSALLENGDKISVSKQRELLKGSHDDAEWLICMVENLLSITRMNAGETKIKKTSEAVEEIIAESVRKFHKRFPDVIVFVSVPEKLLMVSMDAILIEQVIMNLLENAVLHGKGMTEIRLCVTVVQKKAVFEVRDNGVGISENAFPHLFDGSLMGEEREESDNKRNMGIGLSVCMSIVRAHGGDMTAYNSKMGGAVFVFTLSIEDMGEDVE